MSKTRYKFRQALAFSVALLQLAVLPATYTLHVGCKHARDHDDHRHGFISSIVACFSGHHCSCSHAADVDNSDDESSSREQPHDSESCTICQTAFAAFTAESFAPQLTTAGNVSVIVVPEVFAPASEPHYRSLSRGPPVWFRVS